MSQKWSSRRLSCLFPLSAPMTYVPRPQTNPPLLIGLGRSINPLGPIALWVRRDAESLRYAVSPRRRLLWCIAKQAHCEFPPTWPRFTQFINLISGVNLGVGNGLRSCTSTVQIAGSFDLDGRRVVLIDTPGFDDTTRSDTDVLNTIASFLATT